MKKKIPISSPCFATSALDDAPLLVQATSTRHMHERMHNFKKRTYIFKLHGTEDIDGLAS